jgi:hypothetical protein
MQIPGALGSARRINGGADVVVGGVVEQVERARDSGDAFACNVGINHCCFQALVPQKHLHERISTPRSRKKGEEKGGRKSFRIVTHFSTGRARPQRQNDSRPSFLSKRVRFGEILYQMTFGRGLLTWPERPQEEADICRPGMDPCG